MRVKKRAQCGRRNYLFPLLVVIMVMAFFVPLGLCDSARVSVTVASVPPEVESVSVDPVVIPGSENVVRATVFGANGIGQVNHVAITDTDLEGLSLPIEMKRVSVDGNIRAEYAATISLPSGTPLQNYTLTVTATDRKDNIGTGSATFTVTDERVGIMACDDKGPGNVSFTIPEPAGGELKLLAIEGKPLVNRVIKVVAHFENTGTSDTMAKFTGPVYRDGELVDILEGNEMFIEVGKNIPLIAYYKIMIPGEYQIKGTVIYDGKETEGKGVSFTVPEQE